MAALLGVIVMTTPSLAGAAIDTSAAWRTPWDIHTRAAARDHDAITIADDRGRVHVLTLRTIPGGSTPMADRLTHPGGMSYRFTYTREGRLDAVTQLDGDTTLQTVRYGYEVSNFRELEQIILPGSDQPYAQVTYATTGERSTVTGVSYGLGSVVNETLSGGGREVIHRDTDAVLTSYRFRSASGVESMLCEREALGPVGQEIVTTRTYTDELRPLVTSAANGIAGTETLVWQTASKPADRRGSDRLLTRTRTAASNGVSVSISGVDTSAAVPLVESWTWKGEALFFQLDTATDTAGIATSSAYTKADRASLRAARQRVDAVTNPADASAPEQSSDLTITTPDQGGGNAVAVRRFNAYGQPTRELSAAGALTEYRYTPRGNAASEAISTDGAWWLEAVAQTTTTGHAIGYAVPAPPTPLAGESVVPDPAVIVAAIARDRFGRVIGETSPRGAQHLTKRDGLDRVTTRTAPPLFVSGDERTRAMTTMTDFNGRGFAATVTTQTPVLTSAIAPVLRVGEFQPAVGSGRYQLATVTQVTARDGLDRPTEITEQVGPDGAATEQVVRHIRYEFGRERMQSQLDPERGATVLSYDAFGRIRSMLTGVADHTVTGPGDAVDARGIQTTLDAAGNVTGIQIRYGGNATVVIPEEARRYDGFGRLVEITALVSERVSRTVYDDKGRIAGIETVDGKGDLISRVRYVYDSTSGALAQTQDLLTGTQTTHSAQARTLTDEAIGADGRIERSIRDGAGRERTNFLGLGTAGLHTALRHDNDGNFVTAASASTLAAAEAVIGPNPNRGTEGGGLAPMALYNLFGQAVRQRRPELGASSVVDHLPCGFGIAGSVDEIGASSLMRHDGLGRVIATYEFDKDGRPRRFSRSAEDRTQRASIEVRFGTPASEIAGASPDQIAVARHDRMGRVVAMDQVSFRTPRQDHPGLSDLAETETYATLLARYVINRNPVTEIAVQTTTTTYDHLGRVASEAASADGLVRTYHYYPENDPNPNDRRQLREVTVASPGRPERWQRRLQAYGRFGQPTILLENQPLQTQGQLHGTVVELVQERGASDGVATTFAHGLLTREATRLLHEATGAVVSPEQATVWTYDAGGKREAMTLPSGAVLTYAYDHATWPKQMTLTQHASAGGGSAVVWKVTERDAQQRPSREERWNSAITLGMSRSGFAQLGLPSEVRVTLGGSEQSVSRFGYDQRGAPVNRAMWSTGSEWTRRTVFDGLGRLSATTAGTGDLFGDEAFGIDAMDIRAQQARIAGEEVDYEIGAFGRYNRAFKRGSTSSPLFLSNLAPAIDTGSAQSPHQVFFTWSDAGLLASDGIFTYTWDGMRRLVGAASRINEIQGYNGQLDPRYTVAYAYDALGRRVFREEARGRLGLSITEYGRVLYRTSYDGGTRLEEHRQTGAGASASLALVARTSTSASGDPAAHETWSDTGAHRVAVLITDSDGSVVGVASPDGALLERIVYSSSGIARVHGDPGARGGSRLVPYGWGGAYRDPITGLLWRGADYDPVHGLALSTEPHFRGLSRGAVFANRIGGAARTAVGVAEGAIGGLMVAGGVAKGWTGAGIAVAAAGTAVFTHGADSAAAGLNELITGRSTDSFAMRGFMALGMSRGGAELADMGVGLAGGFAYGAVRGTSVAANSIGRQAVAGAGRRVFMPQVNAYHLTADEAGRQLPLMLTDDVLEALAKAPARGGRMEAAWDGGRRIVAMEGTAGRGGQGILSNGDTVPYGSSTPGFEQHHHVWDVWLKHNVPGYKSRVSGFPTLALSPGAHNATRSIHTSWLNRARKTYGGRIDWNKVSASEMQNLTEEMARAAGVSAGQLQRHYRSVNQWLYTSLP